MLYRTLCLQSIWTGFCFFRLLPGGGASVHWKTCGTRDGCKYVKKVGFGVRECRLTRAHGALRVYATLTVSGSSLALFNIVEMFAVWVHLCCDGEDCKRRSQALMEHVHALKAELS